jgi:hypothetical protein
LIGAICPPQRKTQGKAEPKKKVVKGGPKPKPKTSKSYSSDNESKKEEDRSETASNYAKKDETGYG